MISVTQIVYLLICLSVVSVISFALYRLQEVLSVRHQSRIVLLKITTVAIWLLPLLGLLMNLTRTSYAVGKLFPQSQALTPALKELSVQSVYMDYQTPSLLKVALVIYGVGIVVAFVRLVRSYFQMRTILLSSSEATAAGIPVRISRNVQSPFSFGFLNPQIFLPFSYLETYSQDELRVIVNHEQIHVQNRDPQWKLISLLTRGFLFFVPTSWALHNRLDLELEIVCDEMTMLATNTTLKKYGETLIQVVELSRKLKPNPMFAYMSETNLSRRIYAMKAKTLKRPFLSLVFSAALVLAGTAAVAATAGIAKLNEQYFVAADIYVDGKLIASPQFVVNANEPASIEVGSDEPPSSLNMAMVASDFSSTEISDGIELKMDLEYKTAAETFKAKPHLVVKPKEDGVVTFSNDHGEMRMILRAERR